MCDCNYKKYTEHNTNIKINTLKCNPIDTALWCNQIPLNEYDDNNNIVKSNIVNGCWECNYDDSYQENNYLYNRSIYGELASAL